jgi:hypothetical protein
VVEATDRAVSICRHKTLISTVWATNRTKWTLEAKATRTITGLSTWASTKIKVLVVSRLTAHFASLPSLTQSQQRFAGCFACGMENGFRIFNTDPPKEKTRRGIVLQLAMVWPRPCDANGRLGLPRVSRRRAGDSGNALSLQFSCHCGWRAVTQVRAKQRRVRKHAGLWALYGSLVLPMNCLRIALDATSTAHPARDSVLFWLVFAFLINSETSDIHAKMLWIVLRVMKAHSVRELKIFVVERVAFYAYLTLTVCCSDDMG